MRERFFIYFTFSLIIYHVDIIEPCSTCRTCVTHKNIVYDLARHESFHSSVVRESNRYSGRSWVRLPLGTQKCIFWVIHLRTLFHLFHFIQATISFIIDHCSCTKETGVMHDYERCLSSVFQFSLRQNSSQTSHLHTGFMRVFLSSMHCFGKSFMIMKSKPRLRFYCEAWTQK